MSASAIGIVVSIEFGKRNAEGNCGPGKGICKVSVGVELRATPGANGTDNGVQVIKGDASLDGGELTIKLSERVNPEGQDDRGNYQFFIDKPTPLDAATAKSLGVSGGTILPGKYVIQNGVVKLKVKSAGPRDAASGLPTGKR